MCLISLWDFSGKKKKKKKECAIYTKIQRTYVVRLLSSCTPTFKNPKYVSSCNGSLVCMSLYSGHKSNPLCWKGKQTSLKWRIIFHTKQRRTGIDVYPIRKWFCFRIPMPSISRNTCSQHKVHLSKGTFSSFPFFFNIKTQNKYTDVQLIVKAHCWKDLLVVQQCNHLLGICYKSWVSALVSTN